MSETFSKEERAAMREAAKERKLQQTRAESLASTLERIESMTPADRELAMALHKLALEVNPDFEVRTWYGMPAYYLDGQIVLFFQDGEKFKTRYSTIGFQQAARLDSGTFWATSYAVTAIDSSVAKEITALIKKALG
ncbi:MAG: hypothetical protein RLY83_52 [Actinomycetota bacterium]|jgi:uncharacterized protein YdhG (YjbR/CyaY superfamily)